MHPEQPDPSFDILVVDDEPPISDILTRIGKKVFPEANFIGTRSTQETITYLDTHTSRPPQLILLDIDLNQAKNGLDLLPDLWERFQGSVPIIMLSMLTEQSKVTQAYEKGAVAYTQKPEDMPGWQNYIIALRDYWHRSARLPTIDPPLE